MAELARRIAKRDPYHLGTTGAQQIRRWESGQRPRFESETIAAIAAETGQPVSFFYSSDDDGAASQDEEEAAQVTVTFTGSANVVADLMARLKVPVPVG